MSLCFKKFSSESLLGKDSLKTIAFSVTSQILMPKSIANDKSGSGQSHALVHLLDPTLCNMLLQCPLDRIASTS